MASWPKTAPNWAGDRVEMSGNGAAGANVGRPTGDGEHAVSRSSLVVSVSQRAVSLSSSKFTSSSDVYPKSSGTLAVTKVDFLSLALVFGNSAGVKVDVLSLALGNRVDFLSLAPVIGTETGISNSAGIGNSAGVKGDLLSLALESPRGRWGGLGGGRDVAPRRTPPPPQASSGFNGP